LFNIERLTQSVDIKSYAYLFVALVATVTIALPRLHHIHLALLLTFPIPLFLFLKVYMEDGFWYEDLLMGNAFPLTVTQIGAIILTGLLSRQVTYKLDEVQRVIASITFHHIGQLPPSLMEAQEAVYQEVKRARHYERPLSVIALKVDQKVFEIALPQIVKEVQHAMRKEFVLARIARILDQTLHDFETITLRHDCFILVLPETDAEHASLVAERLKEAVRQEMKLKLKVGAATFPEQAVTFEGLIELATHNLNPPSFPLQAAEKEPEQSLELLS
jgi:GGDEF domain-containing protein